MRRRNYPTSIVTPTNNNNNDAPSPNDESSSSPSSAGITMMITTPPRPNPTKFLFAESILQNAGGCPILRRFVFQYLDRYEALRLSDVCPSWREASSHPASWLPLFMSSARSGSGANLARSITVSANENSSRSVVSSLATATATATATTPQRPPGALLSPGDAPLNFSNNNNDNNNTTSDNQGYLPPNTIPDVYSSSTNPNLNSTASMFASYSKQIVARAAFPPELTSALFGKNTNNSDAVDYGGVNNVFATFSDAQSQANFLEKLWDLKTPEIYFSVSEILRKPSRELAAVLEYCEKLLSLVHQAQYSNLNLHSAAMAVQTQLFVALELLAHPVAPPPPPPNPLTGAKQTYRHSVYAHAPEKKRFLHFFPSALILLRCPLLLRVAALEYKVPASLHQALNKNEFLKEDMDAKARNLSNNTHFARNLSPVVIIFTEMLRWHQADPARENAAWFCTLCSWVATIPQLFSSPSVISSTTGNATSSNNSNVNPMVFHPVYLLPHILTLRSLCLNFPASLLNGENSNNDSFGGANTPVGNNSFSSSMNNNNNTNVDVASTASNNNNNPNLAMEAEECKDNLALRTQLNKHLDAEAIVKFVVRSCVELALRLWNMFHKKGSESILIQEQQQQQQQQQQNENVGASTRSRISASDLAMCFDTLAKLEFMIRNDVIWFCSNSSDVNKSSSKDERERNAAARKKYFNLVRDEVAEAFAEHDGTGECGVSMLELARSSVEKKFATTTKTVTKDDENNNNSFEEL